MGSEMCIRDRFCVICLDTIADISERELIVATLEDTQKEIVEISMHQMMHFAGNMLQVRNDAGERYLVMSEQACKSLIDHQIAQIKKHCKILTVPIYTIEKYGGGSVRCMMAEVFCQRKMEHAI